MKTLLQVTENISIVERNDTKAWTHNGEIIKPTSQEDEILLKMIISQTPSIKVIRAAATRFGEVIGIIRKCHSPSYLVACIRNNAPIPEAPAMLITALINEEGSVEFHWGHYDLTEEQALDKIGPVGGY